MKDYIYQRVLDVGNYIIETGVTVRKASRKFNVSKSTVHKDMIERLPKINPGLAERVKEVLDTNKAERHIRGGKATKDKYQSFPG